MGRWSQYDEDSARLPHGMKRVGYDSDTRRYTFRDENGVLYQSAPGNEYGTLTPVSTTESIQRARPNAFESSDPSKRRPTLATNSNLKSFEDFVPASAIISPPPSPTKRSMLTSPTGESGSSSSSRLRDAFFKVKAMKSASSRMLAPTSDHNKSPSLPTLPSSKSRRSLTPPPLPTRQRRGYSQLPERRQGEESTRLLRSKTVSSRSSADSSSSYSFPPHPSRSSSRASRISAVSTTSTVTPKSVPRHV